ncbi:D-alanyl-D-alanine carboxypeptidase/D-alanyl-D-alanine-endopeptidase [bacterium]|nr:D-alanyl-D-alanine carboxypeptidase/D-alanyl-D-alanine-endopeptidase [bacterium]
MRPNRAQLLLLLLSQSTKVVLLLAIVVAGLTGCMTSQEVTREEIPLPLPVDVDAIAFMADTTLIQPLEAEGATVAAIVGDARTGAMLYAHDEARTMLPASVQKLFVAADAMLRLPTDYRFETTIYSNGPVVNDTLFGDLIISGGWDPSLSGAEPYSEWPWAVFDSLAHQVWTQGVRHIAGNVIAEGAAFLPGGWEVGDLEYRFAPRIAQLMWNDGSVSYAQAVSGVNSVGLKVSVSPDPVFWSAEHGELWPMHSARVLEPPPPPKPPVENVEELAQPVTLNGSWTTTMTPSPRPRVLAGDAFRESLRRAGVSGGDSTRAVSPLPHQLPRGVPNGLKIVHQSVSLDGILAPMLKVSSNAWAEQIAAAAGTYTRDQYQPTWPSVLDSLGMTVDPGLKVADNCGMARRNRMTVSTPHELLVKAYAEWGGRWLNLLPQADEDGSTLEGRLAGLGGRVVAKTGTLSGCRSLAGYVLDENGRPMMDFVVFVNHAPESPTWRMDEFVRKLVAEYDGGRAEE